MQYFDSHAHLNLPQFDSDRDTLIPLLGQGGFVVNTVGVDIQTSQHAVDLATLHRHLYATIGLHPAYVSDELFDISAYRTLAAHPKTIGIGECGFDFYRTEKTPEIVAQQEVIFRQHIELAVEYKKPLMIHTRSTRGTYDAYGDVLRVWDSYAEDRPSQEQEREGRSSAGQIHFFAGDIAIMQEFVRRGFYISFTGVVTFTREYDAVIRAVPADRLLAETDAPYVAPDPFRGHRCDSSHVEYVYRKLAEIRGDDPELFRQQILQNAHRLYKIE